MQSDKSRIWEILENHPTSSTEKKKTGHAKNGDGSGISKRQTYQSNAMCGCNLDTVLKKLIIKGHLETSGKNLK